MSTPPVLEMLCALSRLGLGSPTLSDQQIAIRALPFVLLAVVVGCAESPSKDGQPLGQVVRESSALSAADADEHEHTNQLIHETSPYLLQHAHNPVNWHPWGDEAFEKAKREDKPIFLSVGYSTCYWCHVMERESFENEKVAAILNEHFIAIKVDREELPDVDEQYILATQVVTGRGGWPNSVWLTPDGKPWMAGSYFPPEQFKQVLKQLASIWATRRADVEQQANRLSQAIRNLNVSNTKQGRSEINQALVDQAITALKQSYDSQHAGFGHAPKFPPHAALRLVIHEYRRSRQADLLGMTTATLDAIARGGIRDHIGGGFHRYATDRRWFLPHFEKMLYDNAQLMRVYADGYLITGDEQYREVVDDIFRWLDREMTAPEGAFYSALDSESDGQEGKSYVWTYDEVLQVLGPERGQLFAEIYGFQPQGNWVEEAGGDQPGTNIPFLPDPSAETARKHRLDSIALKEQIKRARAELLAVRSRRPPPRRDDKILTSWNGLMISSLAYAGRTMHERRYVDAAARAAQFILDNMRDTDGRLLRVYRQGQAKQPGYLDDYAFFADGLLELYAATGDDRWLTHAEQISDVMLTEFEDPQKHGFFFSSNQHDELLMRSKNLFGGGNLPSSNAVAVQVLLRLGHLTGESRYLERARRALESLAGMMWQSPQGNESLVLAAAKYLEQSAKAQQRP